jgi:hypothetical protein
MAYDAKFHALQELANLLNALFPEIKQLTKEQSDLLHTCAEKLAHDLTSGEYE